MHTNRHQEAKLLPSDTFLTCKNAPKYVCGRGSAPDPAGGVYSAPPNPLAGNRGGPPREGEGKREEGRGEVEWEGNREGLPPERKCWLRPCVTFRTE